MECLKIQYVAYLKYKQGFMCDFGSLRGYARTSLEMDGTLTLIFANSVTAQDIRTKFQHSYN